MRFIVDTTSLPADAEVHHLLSFDGVEGIEVHHRIVIEESDGQSVGIIGLGTHHVLAGPADQHRRLAGELASRTPEGPGAGAIARTLAYVYIANRLEADALVTSLAPVFTEAETGWLNGAVLVSPAEALAMIGSNVRLRDKVPLCGDPRIVQS